MFGFWDRIGITLGTSPDIVLIKKKNSKPLFMVLPESRMGLWGDSAPALQQSGTEHTSLTAHCAKMKVCFIANLAQLFFLKIYIYRKNRGPVAP